MAILKCRTSLGAGIALLLFSACQDDINAPQMMNDNSQQALGVGTNAVTVLTRNLYLGAKIEAITQVPGNLVPFALAGIWANVQATDFAVRAEALADEIAATRPQLIGLQEVTTYKTQDPSDFVLGQYSPNASDVAYDFLALLLSALNSRGLHYNVAAQTHTTDIEIPAYTGVGPLPFIDLRYQDSEVILVRSDVDVLSTYAQTFDARIDYSIAGLTVSEKRGWTAATVDIGRRELTFVNTHLLGQETPSLQTQQAEQLLEWIDGLTRPVILVGDFNSAANPNATADKKTATYDMLLNAGFTDLWDRGNKPNGGLTCCFDELLTTTDPNFDQRLDLILVNQQLGRFVGSAQLAAVGTDPAVLTATGLWPSDHAGVFAVLHLPMK